MNSRFTGVVVLAFSAACAPPPPPTEAGLREQAAPAPAPTQGQCRTPGVHLEVVNKGNEMLEVLWLTNNRPPTSFRIGEAGLGTSYLRVADHIREQIFSKRGGYFNVRDASGRNYAERNRQLNYRLRLRCTEDIDPSKR